MNFDSSNQPTVGGELDLNSYYSDFNGKRTLNMKLDFSSHYVLTRDQIDIGLKVSLIFKKKETYYVGAYIDAGYNEG